MIARKRRFERVARCRLVLLAFVLLMAPAVAAAQGAEGCFRLVGEGAARRVQLVVGLSSVLRLSGGCAYAVTPEGPWYEASELVGRDTDFLELLELLGSGRARRAAVVGDVASASQGRTASGDPRFLFGRPLGGSPRGGSGSTSLHTLILRYCAHYLLEEQLGFRVLPAGADGGVRLERFLDDAGARCDADAVELRAVRGDGRVLLSTAPRRAEESLELPERSLELPPGEWAIYAARPAGRVALRVGVFRATGAITPLQRYLRAQGGGGGTEPALFATLWREDAEGLLLVPTEHARSQQLLWSELRTAADAGLLWLARSGQTGQAPVVVEPLGLEGGASASVRFPDEPARELMRVRYGEASLAMTPTLGDWQAIFSDLSVCLTPSYLTQPLASRGVAAPDPASCAPLPEVLSLEEAAGSGGSSARACLQRGMQVMSASGARRLEPEGEPTCFDLPSLGEPMPFHVALVGDRLTLEGPRSCVLIDNQPLSEQDGGYRLDRSGLLEVRLGGGEGCTGGQALSRLRLAVVDPEREWHPLGLYTEDGPASCGDEQGGRGGSCPWRGLRHDEDEVFAYVRPRHSLEFRFSTSPAVAAAINSSVDGPALVSQDVPLLSGVEGDFEGPPGPALVAFVSRSGSCPAGEGQSVAELRRRRPLEPDGQVVDRLFHVFLDSVEGLDQPPRCLARATFRVHPSRALFTRASEHAGVELGLLGDLQTVAFVTPRPIALGLAMPVAYLRLNLFPIRQQRWLALEIAGDLVLAAAFPDDQSPAAVSRTGASLSVSIQLGIPPWVPRLLSFGVMLHGAFESVPEDPGEDNNPIWSLFLGLDLSTLVDLAGGR